MALILKTSSLQNPFGVLLVECLGVPVEAVDTVLQF